MTNYPPAFKLVGKNQGTVRTFVNELQLGKSPGNDDISACLLKDAGFVESRTGLSNI